MGLLKLVVDTSNKRLVKSFTSAEAFIIPKFIVGDKVSLEVCLVEPNPSGGQQTPFALVDTAPYSLKIAIGLRGSDPWSIQDTWAKTTGAGAKFAGYLDLGSTNMVGAVGSSQSLSGFFEIELNSVAGGYETLIQQEVTVWNQVITGLAGPPVPAAEFLTKTEAALLHPGFVLAAGQTTKWTSPNGLWRLEIGQNNDGTVLMNTTAIPP